MRRIKHQPSPLGLRVHPSTLAAAAERGEPLHSQPPERPLPGQEDGGGFPALGTWSLLLATSPAMCHRSRCDSQRIVG